MVIIKYVRVAIIGTICFWIGIYIGSVSFQWNGFTDGWVSAIGSWVSGIIAGGALFYAMNKDRGDSKKKLNIIESNLREILKRYLDSLDYVIEINDCISKLKKNMDDMELTAGKHVSYHIILGTDSYKPIDEIAEISKKISRNVRISVTNIPDSIMNNVNQGIDEVLRCCDVIDSITNYSDKNYLEKMDCDSLKNVTASLGKNMSKYGEELFNLKSIMTTNKLIEKG